MLKQKVYICQICGTTPDQISHHKNHLESQKHKDKRELLSLKLSKLTEKELVEQYKISNIEQIVQEKESFFYYEKKLNNNQHISCVDDKMSENIEESQGISNREALRDKIHEIHNFLRNNGAGYGMNALKVFNLLYGLKKIEENGLIDMVNLKKPECSFSYLLEKANQNEDEEIASLILGEITSSIYNSSIKDLLYYEIPQNIKGSVFTHLIKEIDKITMIERTCNVLLSGKIYEYFIGRDETAISELGAYFTDRRIVDYIYSKLDSKISENGEIESMIDMFGGSGGFTTGYIDYLNQKYSGSVNWITEINKVFHYDINEDVIKSAGLEFLCLTGVLPNMENLMFKNAFTDEFSNVKFKNIITNPPYGGDKIKQSDAQIKREKIKEYIKNEMPNVTNEEQLLNMQRQLKKIGDIERLEREESDKSRVTLTSCSGRIQRFARQNALTGNDKESCSLILMMELLDVGGTAIGVLKEGVFFNKTYKDLRKCLIEKFNVKEIISVPQDQFENTSTKTSIVIFENTAEKTTEVKFKELIVERYDADKFKEINGEIFLIENKGDVVKGCLSDKEVATATRSEILENAICSLNAKDYNKKVLVCGEDYELVKLGDLCEFLPKSKRQAAFGKKEGKFNFYTSSEKIQKCDIADYDEECLIIGSGGVANIKIDNMFSCSADNFVIKSDKNFYLYNFFKGNMSILSDGFTGSTLKHISKDYLLKLEIPIPKSPAKIQEWVDKISSPYDEMNSKKARVIELESFVQNRIKEIIENEDCEEVELGKLCNIQNGKRIVKGRTETGIYPVLGGGGYTNFYTNIYTHSGRNCKISREGLSIDSCVMILNDKFYLNSQALTITSKDQEMITNNYLWYFLLINKQKVFDCSRGSIQKAIDIEQFFKLVIIFPRDKYLIKEMEPIFQEIEVLQNDIKVAERLYKQYIQELSEEALPTQENQVIQEVINVPIEEIVAEEQVIERVADNLDGLQLEQPDDEEEEEEIVITKKQSPAGRASGSVAPRKNKSSMDELLKSLMPKKPASKKK